MLSTFKKFINRFRMLDDRNLHEQLLAAGCPEDNIPEEFIDQIFTLSVLEKAVILNENKKDQVVVSHDALQQYWMQTDRSIKGNISNPKSFIEGEKVFDQLHPVSRKKIETMRLAPEIDQKIKDYIEQYKQKQKVIAEEITSVENRINEIQQELCQLENSKDSLETNGSYFALLNELSIAQKNRKELQLPGLFPNKTIPTANNVEQLATDRLAIHRMTSREAESGLKTLISSQPLLSVSSTLSFTPLNYLPNYFKDDLTNEQLTDPYIATSSDGTTKIYNKKTIEKFTDDDLFFDPLTKLEASTKEDPIRKSLIADFHQRAQDIKNLTSSLKDPDKKVLSELHVLILKQEQLIQAKAAEGKYRKEGCIEEKFLQLEASIKESVSVLNENKDFVRILHRLDENVALKNHYFSLDNPKMADHHKIKLHVGYNLEKNEKDLQALFPNKLDQIEKMLSSDKALVKKATEMRNDCIKGYGDSLKISGLLLLSSASLTEAIQQANAEIAAASSAQPNGLKN